MIRSGIRIQTSSEAGDDGAIASRCDYSLES